MGYGVFDGFPYAIIVVGLGLRLIDNYAVSGACLGGKRRV